MTFFQELKRRNVVRVAVAYVLLGWAVLQGADFLLDLTGAPDWVIRALAVIGLVGLPFALFFAWAFEITPEGIKREHEVDRSQSVTPQTGRKLNAIIIGLLVFIILLMAVERIFFADVGSPDAGPDMAGVTAAKTIAVLPFTDLSQAQDQGWFADGLAEEILNALVRVPDLSVAARTSSFAYKGSNRPISEIATELGVAHVLEGSVRSSADRIRVTAQLIRASDGFHLWSQNYDRDVADMIGIQEDLARNIATALETSMDPKALAQMAQAGTESVEAYQEYLRGLQAAAEAFNTYDGRVPTRQAYEHFERARAIDPGFFDAHVQAANYWKIELTPSRTDSGTSGLEPPQMLREYNERIGQAVDKARTEADRIRSLADRAMVDLRLREARRLFDQYLELRPNDDLARFERAAVLGMLSDGEAFRKDLAYWKAKGQTDQFAANNYINEAYRWADPGEAADFALEVVQRWPNSSTLLYQAHRTLLWAGRNRQASELATRYAGLVPEGNPLVSAREACASGDRKAAEQILAGLKANSVQDLSTKWILLNMLGDSAAEIEVLRPLEQSGVPFQLASFLGYPKFDARPYPSLMAVLEREGVQRPPPPVPPFRCPPPSEPSVAVLPFVNMSADPDNEYFSDGVSEEILNVLARIPDLKVSARTSAFSFKGSDATIAQIARELGVSHVLEGSVRKSGNAVRVTAQLIEAGSGFHLWSDTYDRELTNIFAIQDDIAQSIAEALKVRLLPAVDQPNLTGTTNLEAYELYLKGVNLWHLRTGESLEQALTLFQQAIQLDPTFARAHAYLALTLGILPDYGDRSLGEIRPATRAAAEAALALDPDSVEAATALITSLLADSPATLESLIERGRQLIARNPGFATTHQWHGNNLLTAGFVEEAVAAYRTGLELDPRSRIIHQNLGILLVVQGRFDEAAKLLENLDDFAPDYWDGVLARFLLYLASGQREAAEAAGNRLAGILGRTRNTVPLYLDLFFAPERRAAAAAEILTFPRGSWWDPDNPALIEDYALPFALAAAGMHDEALSALRQVLGRKRDFYPVALIRASTLTGDFSCRPDVRAVYAELGLPPLPDPPDC